MYLRKLAAVQPYLLPELLKALVTRETEPAVRDDPVTGGTHDVDARVLSHYDVDASVLERAQLY